MTVDWTVCSLAVTCVHDRSRIARLIGSGTFPVERLVISRIALEDHVESGFEVLVEVGT